MVSIWNAEITMVCNKESAKVSLLSIGIDVLEEMISVTDTVNKIVGARHKKRGKRYCRDGIVWEDKHIT